MRCDAFAALTGGSSPSVFDSDSGSGVGLTMKCVRSTPVSGTAPKNMSWYIGGTVGSAQVRVPTTTAPILTQTKKRLRSVAAKVTAINANPGRGRGGGGGAARAAGRGGRAAEE